MHAHRRAPPKHAGSLGLGATMMSKCSCIRSKPLPPRISSARCRGPSVWGTGWAADASTMPAPQSLGGLRWQHAKWKFQAQLCFQRAEPRNEAGVRDSGSSGLCRSANHCASGQLAAGSRLPRDRRALRHARVREGVWPSIEGCCGRRIGIAQSRCCRRREVNHRAPAKSPYAGGELIRLSRAARATGGRQKAAQRSCAALAKVCAEAIARIESNFDQMPMSRAPC